VLPEAGQRVNDRNLAPSAGVMDIALTPFGALPMCYGAGGLQAQYRFGARSGLVPIMFGTALVVLALGFSHNTAALFAFILIGAVGALLLIAGSDLALSRRLLDARPACWTAIGIVAVMTLLVNPAVGFTSGWAVEIGRALWKSHRRTRSG
jgi:MFS superfamily sulfate permease-like transporter